MFYFFLNSQRITKSSICSDVDGPSTCHTVSQKSKNKYRILTHIRGIYKNGTDEPTCTMVQMNAGTEMQM